MSTSQKSLMEKPSFRLSFNSFTEACASIRRKKPPEKVLETEQSFEDAVEWATVIPQVLNGKAWSDQGRNGMLEMVKLLKVRQNTVYRARREFLKHRHEHDSGRASQWGTNATAEKLVPGQ